MTALLLGLAGAVAMATRFFEFIPSQAIVFPLVLLLFNLAAALCVNRKLVGNPGLLGFHIALAILLVLGIADELVSFSGHVEITEGSEFTARMVIPDSGRQPSKWQVSRMADMSFVQGPFTTRYAPGIKRRETESSVFVEGRAQQVGDDRPLVLDGYRFYSTRNMGFSPIFSFESADGGTFQGAVHLPGYPYTYYEQGNDWSPPGRAEVYKLWLSLKDPVFQEQSEWDFRVPRDAVLVLIDGAIRYELRPGQSVPVAGGTVTYMELRSWMGYKISYNPFAPWMLAAIVIGALCLAQFYLARSFVPLAGSGVPRFGPDDQVASGSSGS